MRKEAPILSHQDKGVNVLTQLGLTTRQAEIYLAIVRLGPATVKVIAQTLQIARAEVYRSTAELQKLGLITKNIATPSSFRAVPPSEALSILLQQNAEKHENLRVKAEQIFRNYKNYNIEKTIQENTRYYITSGAKAEHREFAKDLAEIQTSMDCVLNWKDVIFVINKYFKELKEVLKRGVKIRYVTNIPEGTKLPQNIQTLKKTGSFVVKTSSTIPKAGIDIVDKKLVRIISFPDPARSEVEVLRLNNLEIVDLAQEHFELKWNSATTPDSTSF
jgi:sugar-specific transcriptional regulator TrmB